MGLFVGDKAAYAASKPKARSKRGSAFDKQFAAARKAGLKTFAFGGKAFNTDLAPAGGTKTAAASPLSGPAFGIGSPPGMPKPRPDTAVVKTATASVPTPAPAGVGDIYRAQENVRRNPPQADPKLVAQVNSAVARSKEPPATVTTTKTARLTARPKEPSPARFARDDLARKGPRLKRSTTTVAGNDSHDYGALSFFHPGKDR